ncbi:hypothetical protein CHUAL_014142 [Chamberlinius hualienensis]
MFQNHPVSPSYSINPSINSFNYYQPQMTNVTSTNLGDPNWLGWPIWIATDIIVAIGERQFHAHRSVLSANSGYFRSELSSNSIQTDKQATKSIKVTPDWGTSVGIEIFSVLLDFMYTSRLQIDSANVLEVLSAAQMLLMPRVIELCRSYLLQRHLTGCLSDFYSINRTFPSPSPLNLNLNNPEVAPSAFYPTCNSDRGVNPFLNLNRPTSDQYCSASSSALSTHHIIRPIPSKYPYNVISLATPTVGSTATTATETRSSSSPAAKNTQNVAPDDPGTTPSSSNILNNSDAIPTNKIVVENSSQSSSDGASLSRSNSTDKEFMDVACCDGPVKFQRVLNQNCNLVIMMMSGDSSVDTSKKSQESEKTTDDVEEEAKTFEKSDDDAFDEPPPAKASKRVNYRCVYCRHTYKSLCCYLKHKQRHLNPKSKLGFKADGDVAHQEEEKSPESETATTTREINVPFYPCRVCGLKFPSYYFVHKHRRACHKISQAEK